VCMAHSLERWKTWSASKLPGRAVNRFVRGWAVPRLSLSIEVHRTACIVTHPPGGEGANDALCNPANERLQGARFTPDECWTELYGDPTTGRWDEKFLTYPFQSIDGLVTEFGGAGLRAALEAQPAGEGGVRCQVGRAVATASHGELRELYPVAIVHAVAPFAPHAAAASEGGGGEGGFGEGAWERGTVDAYRAALSAAEAEGVASLALPLLGAGVRGIDLPLDESIKVAARGVVGWRSYEAPAGHPPMTVRFGVQSSSTAHALSAALEACLGEAAQGASAEQGGFEVVAPPQGESPQARWA